MLIDEYNTVSPATQTRNDWWGREALAGQLFDRELFNFPADELVLAPTKE